MNCRNCGAGLPAGAIFCGECGSTVAVPKLVTPPRGQASDTVVIPPLPAAKPTPAPAPPAAATPAPLVGEPEVQPAPEPTAPPVPQPPITLVPERAEPAAPVSEPTSDRGDRAAEPFPGDEVDDLEATRIVGTKAGGERFVLQFSTGENTTVHGSGLIGRNPAPEPGETFDNLVTIVDPGKSVSKTHLEFGQTSGAFWVSDRFSGNGTVIRQPDARPQRLQPGRRQTVTRGTRIDIAEQFFVVS